MAQTGFTPLQLYRTSTATAVPTVGNLAAGELAINLTDEKLYFKNAAGAVKLLASNAGSLGSVTSVGGTGTVNGLTLTGTVTSSGNLTLGGTLSGVSLATQVTGTLPVANGGTGITSFGTGVATFLGTPSSANLRAAVTDETGSGSLVFATSPTLVTPVLGTPSSGTLTSCTGLPLTTGVTGTLPLGNGGTGATTRGAAQANLLGFTTTATAAGTTTLTNASTGYQIFTGTNTQTVLLPAVSTLQLGWEFYLVNNSTGNVSIQSSGANPVITLLPGTATVCTCILITGTTAASWEAGYTDFSAATGTGAVVLATSPALVTPALGTPSSATLTNATGLPISTGVSGLGTGVATFLATPTSANLAAAVTNETGTGSLVFADTPTLITPVLGTPTSVTLTNATDLPISTGVSGLGTGVATFLATPSSANLRSAVTDETGTGSLVFADSPTLVTPALGTPSSATLTNATDLPILAGTTGTLSVARGGTGVTTSTGTGSTVLSESPALSGTPTAPTAAVNTNTTQIATTAYVVSQISATAAGVTTFSAGTTGFTPSTAASGAVTLAGTLAVSNGGTGTTTSTGTGSTVLSNSPTLVTPNLGTPSTLVGTNITGTASGFTAGNVTTNANLTGAITSVGNATSLGSFTSANLASALTDETGTGLAVFATSPTLVTPNLGTPSSVTLTNATGLPVSTGISGLGAGMATFLATPTSTNFSAAVTPTTGAGTSAIVFNNSPTFQGKTGFATASAAATVHVAGDAIMSNVDVLSASYDSVSFSVAAQDTTPSDLFFSPDGLRMYVLGSSGDDVNEYVLSTAWLVSSATFVTSFVITSQDATPVGLFFRPDGRKMYMLGSTSDAVFQYTLATPWLIATASYDSVSFSIALEDLTPSALSFRSDGTSMYIAGSSGDAIYQYNLSTAWDISTASYVQSFAVSGQESLPSGLTFTYDGSRMFVCGTTGDDINVYNLTTPWNIGTAAFVNVFSVSGQETAPNGIYIKPDGSKMYIVGSTADTVFQYTVPSINIQLTGQTSAASLDVQQNLNVYGNSSSLAASFNSYTEGIFAVTGTTPALSPTNATIQTWTLSANSTPTAGTWANGQSLTLMIDDGTARTITWTSLPVTWKTNGGAAPTLNTTGFTAIQLWKVGGVIYGARVGDA